ncbi:MAG: hypothetical protein OXN25_20520 [Candidatus Poribacteria bacterium]|nr:hypothetical protein [Candidatus Poribacteria bacterium]MYK16772.1 hypothetical protein [Candidatus Poribacteria bacterium]
MRFTTLVLGMLFIFGLLLTSGISYGYERAIEAEMADAIEAPMIIDDDADASGGQFIWMEGPPLAGGGGEGWAEYILPIPEAGTYALWGKVIAWDGNSDSFWVTWQPADPDENAQETQNTEFRWGVGQGEEWHWDRINHWLDGGTFEREWELEAGETTLRIAVREDATMLDVIFITDNLSEDEAEAGPRDPIPSDSLVPVEPQDKLTTTWGKLKAAR